MTPALPTLLNYAPPPKRWSLPLRISAATALLSISLLSLTLLWSPSGMIIACFADPFHTTYYYGTPTYLEITETDTPTTPITTYLLHWPQFAATLSLSTLLLTLAPYLTLRLLRR